MSRLDVDLRCQVFTQSGHVRRVGCTTQADAWMLAADTDGARLSRNGIAMTQVRPLLIGKDTPFEVGVTADSSSSSFVVVARVTEPNGFQAMNGDIRRGAPDSSELASFFLFNIQPDLSALSLTAGVSNS